MVDEVAARHGDRGLALPQIDLVVDELIEPRAPVAQCTADRIGHLLEHGDQSADLAFAGAGTIVVFSRSRPPPSMLPDTEPWPMMRSRQSFASAGGSGSQRSSALRRYDWLAPVASLPLRASCSAAPASRRQASISC